MGYRGGCFPMTREAPQTSDPMLVRHDELPIVATSFIGREGELDRLAEGLVDDGSIVTVVGPPGYGKTRLALEHAHRAASSGCPTTFVDLTPATGQRDVLVRFATALNAPLGAADELGDVLQQLGWTLKRLEASLVVVDNCEHLLSEVSSALTELRSLAPSARYLVTSRQRLGLEAEEVITLRSLQMPSEALVDDQEITGSAAVQLFVDRANQRDSDFRLGPEEAPTVARIVRALDGNPLAIELCAARIKVLGPAQLLNQLQHRFRLLRAGSPHSGARWSSLQGAIHWSWELLDPVQRSFLAQLSVFRDGFTFEAALRAISLDVEDTAHASHDELLAALEDRSLVHSTAGDCERGERRYWLTESILAFAWERLEEMDLMASACQSHARFFLDSLGPTPQMIHLGGSKEAQRCLEAERANLFAVHDRSMALDPPQAEQALRALVALAPLCSTQGPLADYLRLVETARQASEAQGELDPIVRVGALLAMALVESRRGRFENSCRGLEEALPLARDAGATAVEAYILVILGGILPFLYREKEVPKVFEAAQKLIANLGDEHLEGLLQKEVASTMMWRAPDQAVTFLKRALLLFRVTRDTVREAYTHGHLCTCLYACGKLDDAEKHAKRSLEKLEALGDERWSAHLRTLQALIKEERGYEIDVESVLEHALKVQRQVGNRWLEAFLFMALGEIRLEGQRAAEALAAYFRALEITRPLDERAMTTWTLSGLGWAAASNDRIDEAVAYFDEAEATARHAGIPSLNHGIELRRGHLDLARSRASLADGDREGARQWLAAARSRLERWDESDRRRDAKSVSRHVLVRRPLRSLRSAIIEEQGKLDEGLRVHREGRWFSIGTNEPVSLENRDPLRRVLSALIVQRLEGAGGGLTLEELFSAGWPGEKARPESAANRVYVTLSRLRKLGLGDVLKSEGDGGVSLDPEIPLIVVD